MKITVVTAYTLDEQDLLDLLECSDESSPNPVQKIASAIMNLSPFPQERYDELKSLRKSIRSADKWLEDRSYEDDDDILNRGTDLETALDNTPDMSQFDRLRLKLVRELLSTLYGGWLLSEDFKDAVNAAIKEVRRQLPDDYAG